MRAFLLAFLTTTIIGGLTVPVYATQPMFEEVSAHAGIIYTGQSWGSAWGDFNGDGWMDLWTPNHGALPSLFLNQQDGTFIDIAESVVPADVWTSYQILGSYDAHGAAWLDVDRDGDVDLFQGGDGNNRNHPNQLLINSGGINFDAEVAAAAGIDAPTTSTRRPVGLDWNLDGFVDIYVYGRVMEFFESNHSMGTLSFVDVSVAMDATSASILELGLLTDVDDDNKLEITTGPTPNFLSVFEIDQGAASDLTATLGLLGSNYMVDGVAADLDGDLDQDFYAVRGVHPRDLIQVDDNTLEATLYAVNSEEGFSFVADGEVSVALYPNYQIPTSSIYLGSSGLHPFPPLIGDSWDFVLSSTDTTNYGIAPHVPGTDYGHYIGFDPTDNRWTVLLSAGSAAKSRNFVITTLVPITDLQAIGFTPGSNGSSDLYYRNDGGSFVSAAAAAGFTVPSSARSVAVGDFDNDADLDLYVVSTGIVQNRPNILYSNDGNGFFTKTLDMGAEGPIEGRGDSVAVADYDNDGFLDLFITNGKDKPPFYYDGPYVLMHNLGNTNHWVQMDLVGSASEIQGIGAKITTTAGGISQVRLHGNSSNARSQHMTRSHFGLGSATMIDEIHVRWPSGRQQKLQAVAVDQILSITEPLADSDADADGVFDALDNCLTASNSLQQDTDSDGYGNSCDADFNNDCVINFADLTLLGTAFLGSDELFDLNADGNVNFADVSIFAGAFLMPPGPSGTSLFCAST